MFQRLKDWSNLIVLSHSIFALPFALASLLVATHGHPSMRLTLLVLLAMFFARTAGMANNRVMDADLDAQNPRTQGREIPAGKITKLQALILTWVAAAAFVATCYCIGGLAFKLSPLALGIVLFYSLTKRFTWWCHFFLGLALGLAPVGAWVAAKNALEPAPLFLMGAVVFFVAGFDILYAIKDVDFDRAQGLKSWVVRWGIPASLRTALVLHFVLLLFLAGFGVEADLSPLYIYGVAILGVFLTYQHTKIFAYARDRRGGDFILPIDVLGLNGWVSVLVLAAVGVSLWF
ncbi:MAG TPA: UbiA-like polyprenyltransferase [bacterium]|nr:UbiA-like polyprenyltransferase [bacterium]